MSAGGDSKRVELVVEESEDNVRIRFRQLAGLKGELLEIFPSDREKALLAVLAASLTTEPERQEIVLQFSKDIDLEFSR